MHLDQDEAGRLSYKGYLHPVSGNVRHHFDRDEAGRLSYKGYLHPVSGNVRHHCEIFKRYINRKLKTTLINRIVNRPQELNSF
jgi:hypothetical protein